MADLRDGVPPLAEAAAIAWESGARGRATWHVRHGEIRPCGGRGRVRSPEFAAAIFCGTSVVKIFPSKPDCPFIKFSKKKVLTRLGEPD